ncbi:uncharacterized protein LOC122542716 [Chiloscyllium plagiosum]|uniref:uncharacterized protein LOC122542716 n=1 Tax=Chiloscyllium plagiosum TaxID=36176 RepID=UPI001CB7B04B|nr:uncharacterized protein LOC122542716 [Chiloscyllium plagiosum]
MGTLKWKMHLLVALFIMFHCKDVKSRTIHQTPAAVSQIPETRVKLQCRVETASTINMFWYRQAPGKGLQLMFYSNIANRVDPEGLVDGFTAEKPNNNEFNLETPNLWLNNSAVYYCAWSIHSDSERGSSSTKTPKGCTKQPRMTSLIASARLAVVDSQIIQQIPAAVSKIPGENVTLKCTVQGISNTWMYWYRQSPEKEPQYMFHSAGSNIVSPDEPVDGFTAERPGDTEFNLEALSLRVDHSAVYFCGWSLHIEYTSPNRMFFNFAQ